MTPHVPTLDTMHATPPSVGSEKLNVTVFPTSVWPDIAPVWRDLVRTSKCSVFLTAEWIEAWLEVFGRDLCPKILMFRSDQEPVGICLLVRNRAGLVPVKRIWLNAAGEPSEDTTYIEYNNVVARAGWETPVSEAAAKYIERETWDELFLTGFANGTTYDILKNSVGAARLTEKHHPTHYVDLAAIRKAGVSYVNFLTGKSGKHLRENLRYYAASGTLAIKSAQDVPEALAMLDELAELSRKRWAEAARRSIFCSSRFVAFHRLLIGKCFDLGRIQLMRVTAGEQVIGVVYNLVHLRKVCFYQCGYSYSAEKRLSPGRATLALVIQQCLNAGYDDFDFLSGESKYKESMATGSRSMVWATLSRGGVKLRVLDALRRIVRGQQ
jgi:CelD/BcsL family acetyltransferase involved in cellulose biosynthesis